MNWINEGSVETTDESRSHESSNNGIEDGDFFAISEYFNTENNINNNNEEQSFSSSSRSKSDNNGEMLCTTRTTTTGRGTTNPSNSATNTTAADELPSSLTLQEQMSIMWSEITIQKARIVKLESALLQKKEHIIVEKQHLLHDDEENQKKITFEKTDIESQSQKVYCDDIKKYMRENGIGQNVSKNDSGPRKTNNEVSSQSQYPPRPSIGDIDRPMSRRRNSSFFTSIRNKFLLQTENEVTEKMPEDMFSVLACSKMRGLPFMYALAVFALQVTMFALLAADLSHGSDDGSFDIPQNVDTQVRATQVIAIIAAVLTQSDLQDGFQQAIDGYVEAEIFEHSSFEQWSMATAFRLCNGALGLAVTFLLIITSRTVFDLLLNFTAMEFVSYLDNISFSLAVSGLLGRTMKEETERIQSGSYPKKRRKKAAIISSIFWLFLVCCLFAGWGIVVKLQVGGAALCKHIHVEFADNILIDLGGASGPYDLDITRSIDGRKVYLERRSSLYSEDKRGKIAYCKSLNAWTFSYDNIEDGGDDDACTGWKVKSSPTSTYDVREAFDSPWLSRPSTTSTIMMELNFARLICLDGNDRCTIKSQSDCLCPPGTYGMDCTSVNPCRHLEINEIKQFKDSSNHKWSSKYSVITGTSSSEAPSIQAYSHPIYLGEKETPTTGGSSDMDDNFTDVLLFSGRRWILTHTGAIKDITKNATRNEIVHFFEQRGFHIQDLERNDVGFISETTVLSDTPFGLTWYSAAASGSSQRQQQQQSILPSPNIANPIKGDISCVECNNVTTPCLFDGQCQVDGNCDCLHGTSGTLCRIAPPSDGICDIMFNHEELEHDNGDCCGLQNPCQYNGTCLEHDGSCMCRDGTRGKFCDELYFTSTDELYKAVDKFLSDNYGNPIGNWDVSRISDFSNLFASSRNSRAQFFDDDISQWNTSSAILMKSTFRGASSFSHDLSLWNVHNVIDMAFMFKGASNFNGDISDWDTSNVNDMSGMFNDASSFDGNLSSWSVDRVTSMSEMFRGAESFSGGDLSAWNVSKVRTMSSMFDRGYAFNGDISTWDTSSVTNMFAMFWGASQFNGDLSTWSISKVTVMYAMFEHAPKFNSDISGWDISQVTHMDKMLTGAESFNRDLCAWGNKIQSSANVLGIFASTNCSQTETPDLSATPPGPFCYPCYSETEKSPSLDLKDPVGIKKYLQEKNKKPEGVATP